MALIKITGEYCKGCGLCIRACPNRVIRLGAAANSMGYHVAETDPGRRCVACGLCAAACPEGAIEVYR